MRIDPSPLPWGYDASENLIRAADGTEVCRFPSAKAYPIDIVNGRLIAKLTLELCPPWQNQTQETK